jgi:hypothetical protein
MEALRERLPNRRFVVHVEFDHENQTYIGGAGYYPDGRLGEVWLRAKKHDSQLDAIACDAAILGSMLFQYGAPAAEVVDALRSGRGGGALGRLLELVEAPEHMAFLEGCRREQTNGAACGRLGGVRTEGAAAQGGVGGAASGGPD